jgi:hypothetical protein
MEANGWGDTWLPSQGEPPKPWLAGKWEPLARPTWSRKHDSTPAWMCVWWREFREWVTAGREPDPGELARLLDERTAARRATTTIGRRFVDEVMAYDPRTDDIADAITAGLQQANADTVDAWASVLDLVRVQGESDESFRARLLTSARGGYVREPMIAVAGRRIRDIVNTDRARVESDRDGSTVTFSVWAGGQDDEFLLGARRSSVRLGQPVDVHIEVGSQVAGQGPHVFDGRSVWSTPDVDVATYTLRGVRVARVADPDPRA